MRILAIETSCDETAVAVVEGVSPTEPVKILSNVVASSEEMHKATGGIVPEVAAREQIRSIIPVIDKAIQDLRFTFGKLSASKIQDIDAIAVTVGPGLVGSLLVGIETAKTLAYTWDKPLIPVNHLSAHLYANFVGRNKIPEFPAIGLVVSGGHTDLVLMEGHGKLRWLGGTRDDAAGECFDKCARILGLPYPGGPAVAAEAAKFKVKSSKLKVTLPRPMIKSDDYDFSFSGLKTAVARLVESEKFSRQSSKSNDFVSFVAHELQEAIVEVLVAKVEKAVEEFKPRSVLLGGGVAANQRLRDLLNNQLQMTNVKLFIPSLELCTDNAVYIAAAAYYIPTSLKASKGELSLSWKEIQVDPGLEIV